MPTILTHPVVPLAIGMGLGSRIVPPRLLLAGAIASVIPDMDVAGFSFGVSYGSPFGHRGFSHSPLFALAFALLGATAARALRANAATVAWFLLIAMASHGVLDAFTNGGLGIAFLWPWIDDRYFAPVQMIAVSPIGLSRFLSARGVDVLVSELQWVWLPFTLFGMAIAVARRRLTQIRSAAVASESKGSR